MLVGICQIELFLPNSSSLKEKRFTLNSLKTKIRNRFNVSVSEVGDTGKWQRGTLGIALVSSEKRLIDQSISQILNMIDNDGRTIILNYSVEVV